MSIFALKRLRGGTFVLFDRLKDLWRKQVNNSRKKGHMTSRYWSKKSAWIAEFRKIVAQRLVARNSQGW